MGLILGIVLGISIFGLIAAYLLAQWVLRKETGSEAMRRISDAIKQGAEAFLRRQNRTIIMLAVLFAALLFVGYGFIRGHHDFDPVGSSLELAAWITLSFVLGALCSVFAGYMGMWVSIRSNIRTAHAALSSINDALRIALRGGAVSGLLVVAMSLLGVSGLYALVNAVGNVSPTKIPLLIVGYGFGASFVALFAQLGGGIYTKAADVGADLVGKVEAGIPEDDPRNPAVIADLVGDNVGDCAGMAADIFESYEVTIVAGLILALALWHITGRVEWIIFPLMVRGIGVLSSIIGTYVVRGGPGKSGNAMASIFRGFLSSAAISAVLFFLAGYFYLQSPALGGWWRTPTAVAAGVLLAILIDRLTEYFTGTHAKPVKDIKKAADTGPATLILQGVAVGFESSVWSIVVIALTIVASILIFGSMPGADAAQRITFILYGVAMTGIGMLTLTGNNVAMDSFGPIC
ncbi:MAG TPA: sodium/proton-translocating pyrophosphatase, partial [bacterium]